MACQGTCPDGKKASALVVALPEIWDHQFSSFRNNTLAKYINSQYESRQIESASATSFSLLFTLELLMLLKYERLNFNEFKNVQKPFRCA